MYDAGSISELDRTSGEHDMLITWVWRIRRWWNVSNSSEIPVLFRTFLESAIMLVEISGAYLKFACHCRGQQTGDSL